MHIFINILDEIYLLIHAYKLLREVEGRHFCPRSLVNWETNDLNSVSYGKYELKNKKNRKFQSTYILYIHKIPGVGAALEKNQEPEPQEKKVRSWSR